MAQAVCSKRCTRTPQPEGFGRFDSSVHPDPEGEGLQPPGLCPWPPLRSPTPKSAPSSVVARSHDAQKKTSLLAQRSPAARPATHLSECETQGRCPRQEPEVRTIRVSASDREPERPSSPAASGHSLEACGSSSKPSRRNAQAQHRCTDSSPAAIG